MRKSVKELVGSRAHWCCEYCLSPVDYSSDPFAIEHVMPLAKVSLILIILFKDNIQALALAGNNDTLSLLLGFLAFMVIGVLGIAAFYAIAAKEINGEEGRPVARVANSERVAG